MAQMAGWNQPMLIRPGKPEDVPDIETCAEAAFGIYTARIGRRPAPMDADWAREIALGRLFVLEAEGALVGYIVMRAERATMHIEAIALLPPFQGRGLGRALVNFAEQQAVAAGLSALELYTNAKMTENLELYPRLGFVETDRRVQYGYARVFFSKPLKPS